MIWTLLPGAVFLADGCLKKKAEEELKENEQIPVCKGHIVLRKCHNRGVAGGGFADSTKKVEILTFFLLSGLWARLGALAGRRKCKAKKLGLALTIGGGMSNWYDRHKRGYVTDYVSFRFGPEKFRRLVFNVSDFCIFFGLALLRQFPAGSPGDAGSHEKPCGWRAFRGKKENLKFFEKI